MQAPMEDCLQGVYDYTLAQLETILQGIETARSCVIPRWEYIDTAEIMDAAQLKIEIVPSKSNPDYVNLEVDPVIGDHFYDNAIDIFISHSHSTPKELNYTLLRYGEAFAKMIRDDSRFDRRFNWVRLVEIDYSPLAQFGGECKKVCTVSIIIKD
jgi:hypothetical protein